MLGGGENSGPGLAVRKKIGGTGGNDMPVEESIDRSHHHHGLFHLGEQNFPGWYRPHRRQFATTITSRSPRTVRAASSPIKSSCSLGNASANRSRKTPRPSTGRDMRKVRFFFSSFATSGLPPADPFRQAPLPILLGHRESSAGKHLNALQGGGPTYQSWRVGLR